jgi:uncharacterized membrane protein
MPYHWSHPPRGADPNLKLELWPHRSLPRRGFAGFVLATFILITIPLYPLLGTVLLWGLLPFVLLAVGGVWWALEASYRSARVSEVLTVTPDALRLVHTGARGEVQEWACDRYWARLRAGDALPDAPGGRSRGRDRRVPVGRRAQGAAWRTGRCDPPAPRANGGLRGGEGRAPAPGILVVLRCGAPGVSHFKAPFFGGHA